MYEMHKRKETVLFAPPFPFVHKGSLFMCGLANLGNFQAAKQGFFRVVY